MLEINEAIGYYICDKAKDCCTCETCGGEYCNHTTDPLHIANSESAKLLDDFMKKFHVAVDDYGRLTCTERMN